MSLAGLISGVMGGAAKGYGQYAESELKRQQELDLKKQLLEAQTEKELRIDEIKRTRDFSDKKREIEEIDPMRHQSEANKTRIVGAAETEELANRENALRAGKIQTAKDTALASGEAERFNLAALGKDPAALGGISAKARAGHVDGVGSVAQANLANFELGQKKAVAGLRQELAQTPADDPRRAEIERRIRDITGATGAKGETLHQQVGAARALLQDMDATDEQKAVARDFLAQVNRDSLTKRGGAAPAPAKPGSIDLNQFFLKK